MNKEKANFIIYNNRSKDLVSRFLPKFNIKDFLELENRYKFISSLYKSPYNTDIKFNKHAFDFNYKDILFDDKSLISLQNKILSASDEIVNSEELKYLENRGITKEIINEYKIAHLSYGFDGDELDIMGASLHPLLRKIFNNEIDKGIIIPLFESGELKNVIIRRLSNGPLKYSFAVPEIDIFGLDNINIGDEIWITEGIFDLMAIKRNISKKVVSVSSASWSSIQLMKLILKNPKAINIFSDYDYTGLRTSSILQRFFKMYNIPCRVYISSKVKDPAEHFFENRYTIDDVEEIGITEELLELFEPDEQEKMKDYIFYLKNRIYTI